jgi:hypothetical protein
VEDGKAFKIFLVIFSAIVSVVVGVGGTKLVGFLLSTNDLVYEVTSSEPFIAETESTQIIRIVTENAGKNLVEDLDISLDPKGRRIDQYQLYGINKETVKISQEGSLFHARLQYLNPNEKLIIQLLIRATANSDASLLPNVRAKGVVGAPRVAAQTKNVNLLTIMPAVLSIVLFGVMLPLLMKNILDLNPQRKIMCVLYSKYGFNEFLNRLMLSQDSDVKYILESEALTHYVLSLDPKAIASAISLQEDIINLRKLSSGSRAGILINIAKLYLKLGDEQKARDIIKDKKFDTGDQVVKLKLEAEEAVKRFLS